MLSSQRYLSAENYCPGYIMPITDFDAFTKFGEVFMMHVEHNNGCD